MAITLALFLAVAIWLLIVRRYLRPLTPAEVCALANQRRTSQIARYFLPRSSEAPVDSDFKSNMEADGRFYRVSESLSEFPALAAGLLKQKKHEWVIFAFARDREVKAIWANKGLDRESVLPLLSPEQVRMTATQEKCDTVLVFHNHPGADGRSWGYAPPSQADLNSAALFASALTPVGANLLEYVCTQGRHFRYHQSISSTFMPVSGFVAQVAAANGRSALGNLALHRELESGRSSSGPTWVSDREHVSVGRPYVPASGTADALVDDDGAYPGRLGPEHLADMRCHPEVIAQLQIAVTAALERGEPLDHVLIYGPGDSEKSEIAQAVAGELGVRCFRVSGNGVRRTHDLMSALAHLSNRDVLVVSELDGLPSDLASILSAAAETFCVDVRGVESAERRRLPPFTLVGLASRVSDVPAPLRRVFGIICELQQQP